jgi:hypothetical protein
MWYSDPYYASSHLNAEFTIVIWLPSTKKTSNIIFKSHILDALAKPPPNYSHMSYYPFVACLGFYRQPTEQENDCFLKFKALPLTPCTFIRFRSPWCTSISTHINQNHIRNSEDVTQWTTWCITAPACWFYYDKFYDWRSTSKSATQSSNHISWMLLQTPPPNNSHTSYYPWISAGNKQNKNTMNLSQNTRHLPPPRSDYLDAWSQLNIIPLPATIVSANP